MENNEKVIEKAKIQDDAINAVPLNQRQEWLGPAMIFGGLEFCIPVLMVGSSLIASFSMAQILPILIVAFLIIQWPLNTLTGYIGAKTGLASSILARSAFGDKQARFIIAIIIAIVGMAWWSVQTAVTGNAICAMLGIDYTVERTKWAVITIIVGLIFAIPSIMGFSSMKWTDYIAVPAGLLLCIVGIYLAFRTFGWETIRNFKPNNIGISFTSAVSMILGLNVVQILIAADYTRYAKPTIKDNVLIPLGIVAIGFPLIYVGAVMAIGTGTADIVEVMVKLGFPFWGFLVLWLSAWTSQLVNNYSMGLSLANILKITSNKGRALITFVGTIIAIIVALSGILNHFMEFLYFTSLFFPPMAAIIYVDFFLRKQEWTDNDGWNWMATIALITGIGVGYITTYVYPTGIPVVQSLIVTCIVYYLAISIKSKSSPDKFTPESLLKK